MDLSFFTQTWIETEIASFKIWTLITYSSPYNKDYIKHAFNEIEDDL